MCVFLSCIFLKACAQSIDKKPVAKNIGEQLLAPDSTIRVALGDETCCILFYPDKVNIYSLEGKSKVDEGDHETEPHYVRKAFIGNLDKKFMDVLGYILLSEKNNYSTDATLPQTFYLPVIEFEYSKNKKTASVVISPNDRSWSVVSGGKQLVNYNYRNPELINRLVSGLQNIKPVQKKKKRK